MVGVLDADGEGTTELEARVLDAADDRVRGRLPLEEDGGFAGAEVTAGT